MAAAASQNGALTRFDAQIKTGSVFSGTFYPVDARCFRGAPVPISITFAVRYIGDVGTEQSGADCVLHSKGHFTQFQSADPIISGGADLAKAEVVKAIDKLQHEGSAKYWARQYRHRLQEDVRDIRRFHEAKATNAWRRRQARPVEEAAWVDFQPVPARPAYCS